MKKNIYILEHEGEDDQFLIRDDDTDISHVQLMRTGEFDYWGDGSKLEITPEMFRTFKKNFDARVLGVDIMIDYFHQSGGEAAGWIREITLKENDTQLWLQVEWTERAKEKIMAKEVRYLSADFSIDWKNPETGDSHGPVLHGGGLTNRPFLKGMRAILHDLNEKLDENDVTVEDIISGLKNCQVEKKENIDMKLSELKQAAIVLSDADQKELGVAIGLVPEDTKLADDNSRLQIELAAEKQATEKLTKEIEIQKKEAAFATLMSEGRAVEAQKEAYLAGDMDSFLKLAVPVNLSGTGDGGKVVDKEVLPTTREDADVELMKLSDAKIETNPKLTIAKALSLAIAENPKLAKIAQRDV